MSLADYTALKASIADWIHRADVSATSGQVDDFIDMAEAEFNAKLRVRSMESQTDIAMSGGYLSHPSDWLGWKRLSVLVASVPQDTEPASNEYLDVVGPGTTGQPFYYAVRGSRTYFNRTTNYTVRANYHASITPLSASATTNWLLTKYPQAYLYGTLLQATAYIGDDPRIGLWKQAYDEAMQRVLDDSVKALHGGQTPVMRAPKVY